MINNIMSFLNFNDDEFESCEITTDQETKTKYIRLVGKKHSMFCPLCGHIMHSKGRYKRSLNHPVLQDGYNLIINLEQRRYYCTNDSCRYHCQESFTFVDKFKHNTTQTIFMILETLKDINVSAAAVAERFNVSDTFVHNTVLQYLDRERLPLPEILCVDEVYLNFDDHHKYAIILMDFQTGEIVDIVPSRFKDVYEPYFLSIPIEERRNVKCIVSDMYDPYLNLDNYFPVAQFVIDSFHVIQWINNHINQYINFVKKQYIERDKKAFFEKNNKPFNKMPESDEVYLLNHYRFFLLSSEDNIFYHPERLNKRFNKFMSTYQLERAFMSLDPHFETIRKLKNKYLSFNKRFPLKYEEACACLDSLIKEYAECDYEMFNKFSELLSKYKHNIALSFCAPEYFKSDHFELSINTVTQELRRLSNGPIEGYNRQPKDYKRDSRGVKNIEYTILRLLLSNRKNMKIRATPKTEEEIHTYTGIKRGHYKKHKKKK